MEMKAPHTTAQPQPPSGGGTVGGPAAGGGIFSPAHSDRKTEKKQKEINEERKIDRKKRHENKFK